ncbi:hypothetical protein SRHO_G00215490 [Serrasalmus rhombeus]
MFTTSTGGPPGAEKTCSSMSSTYPLPHKVGSFLVCFFVYFSVRTVTFVSVDPPKTFDLTLTPTSFLFQIFTVTLLWANMFMSQINFLFQHTTQHLLSAGPGFNQIRRSLCSWFPPSFQVPPMPPHYSN